MEHTIEAPTAAQAPPMKNWKKRLVVGLTAVLVSVAAIGILYMVFPTPTPAQAAEQYIEDHYDAIAEDITHAIMPDSPLKAEIAAEILESIAEQAIPYSCINAAGQTEDAAPVYVDCTINARISKPVEISIVAPIDMTVDPDRESFKPYPQVLSATVGSERITLNGLSVDEARRTLSILDPSNLPDEIRMPDLQGLPNPIGR